MTGMKNFTRRQITLAVLPAVIFVLLGAAAGAAGYRFNITNSLPIGIWRITDAIGRDAYVTACVPLNAPMMEIQNKTNNH